MALSSVSPAPILHHSSPATPVSPQCNLSSSCIFKCLFTIRWTSVAEGVVLGRWWCVKQGAGFWKTSYTCPSSPGMDELWDGEEIWAVHSVQLQTKGGSQCLETKTWILHFHFTLFLIHQSFWIFWRWNKFQRHWLHGTLDIEEYVNIIFPSTAEKWRKVCFTSEGPLAPLKGGANPPVPQTQEGWRTASSGFLRTKCASEVSRHCFEIKEERQRRRREENAFWWVSRFEGTGVKAWEGGSEEHSGGLSRKTAKVRGFVWRVVGMKTVCAGCLIQTIFLDVGRLHGVCVVFSLLHILSSQWMFILKISFSTKRAETSAVRGMWRAWKRAH